jgi:putative membrane protein
LYKSGAIRGDVSPLIIWTVAKTQWLRLIRNKLSRLAIIAILFIPLLYCGLYLYAFWNPYGSLNKLPVALVIEDKGEMYHGKRVNYGEKLAKQLQKQVDVKWEIVSNTVAQKGITDDDYYLVVKIPSDFTKRSLSITSKQPTKSQLIFIRNEGKNYIAGTIASRIESELASAVSNQFTHEYVQNMLSLFVQAKSGISHAAEGAIALTNGATQLETALSKINRALQQATNGAKKLDTGANELVSGASSLANGADKVATGTKELAKQVDKINAFLRNLQMEQASKLQNIKSELTKVTTIMAQVQTELNNASTEHPELKPLLNQVEEINHRLNTVKNHQQQFENVLTNTQPKVGQIQSLNNGAQQVATGMNTLTRGVKELQTATLRLQIGISEIQKQFPALIKSTKQLADGNKQLADKLIQATAEQQSDPKVLADIIANPIEIIDQSIYKVSLYGVGLAPYFLPLSLWIGGLMLYFVIPINEKRWRLYPAHPWFIHIGKLLTFVPFGGLQAVITGLVIQYGLGLPIQQPLYYYLFLLCLSYMSIALIGALIGIFGSGLGRLITIVLLVLQLVSSGGTFPINLIPPIFQMISPILPMSYGVTGFRHIIVYHQPDQLIKPFSIVLLYLIASLAITFVGQKRTFRLGEWRERDQLEAH